jgi:uncharacterized protein with NAD-binding domain and iron-sulfur cluster
MPNRKQTPAAHSADASSSMREPTGPKVAVFGAGIAGLTAAHELAERGFDVTVYEAAEDSRKALGNSRESKRIKKAAKPVRLGGMAATQYIEGADLKPFPGGSGAVEPPSGVATGEHGFRFFPAYYLHIWDTLRRIPLYDVDGNVTARTVYDNVQRVIAQAGTAPHGQPSLVIPREAPRSLSELAGSYQEMMQLGYTSNDLSTFFGRVSRYLVTSPERRKEELEEVSTYEYLVGFDPTTRKPRFFYSKAFDEQIRNMPRVLAAFDAQFGDARTNLTTYVQLNMSLDRYDSKADGVLNGPATEVWFDPWYRHLELLGVKFERATLRSFDRDVNGALQAVITRDSAALRKDVDLVFDGAAPDADFVIVDDAPETRPGEEYARPKTLKGDAAGVPYDYFVVATDAFRAELATAHMREYLRDKLPGHASALPTEIPLKDEDLRTYCRNISTVLGLDGFTTTAPPSQSPVHRNARKRRNPLLIDQVGRKRWDRFQTLTGIQFFFDKEFQVLHGHVYYSRSKWGLSSINPTGLWLDKPRLTRDGYNSIMSVDIGDWITKSRDAGNKSAAECSPDELAREVWRQISTELGASLGPQERPELPQPRWYSIDTFIDYTEADGKAGAPRQNDAPYLIPIVGDWKNRPGAYPWNPGSGSPTWIPNKKMRADQRDLEVWQAGHGGYQVHSDKLVFAGTWCKTFTRMTSMEAACESGRHAVNAIIDHWIYGTTADPRDNLPLAWRMPYGFVDQELSVPIRLPTPQGDYCFIYDCENREPGDARPTRLVDAEYFHHGLEHPWTLSGLDQAAVAASDLGSPATASSLLDPLWIIEQLRQWRNVVETIFATAPPPQAQPEADGGPRRPDRHDRRRHEAVPEPTPQEPSIGALTCVSAQPGASKTDPLGTFVVAPLIEEFPSPAPGPAGFFAPPPPGPPGPPRPPARPPFPRPDVPPDNG